MCGVQVQAVCDWVGRSLATYSQWPGLGSLATTLLSSLTVLRWSLCSAGSALTVMDLYRTGFIPLVMMCNVLPGSRTSEVVFPQDWAFIAIFSTFNILGGYLTNTALMLGPKTVGGITDHDIVNVAKWAFKNM